MGFFLLFLNDIFVSVVADKFRMKELLVLLSLLSGNILAKEGDVIDMQFIKWDHEHSQVNVTIIFDTDVISKISVDNCSITPFFTYPKLSNNDVVVDIKRDRALHRFDNKLFVQITLRFPHNDHQLFYSLTCQGITKNGCTRQDGLMSPVPAENIVFYPPSQHNGVSVMTESRCIRFDDLDLNENYENGTKMRTIEKFRNMTVTFPNTFPIFAWDIRQWETRFRKKSFDLILHLEDGSAMSYREQHLNQVFQGGETKFISNQWYNATGFDIISLALERDNQEDVLCWPKFYSPAFYIKKHDHDRLEEPESKVNDHTSLNIFIHPWLRNSFSDLRYEVGLSGIKLNGITSDVRKQFTFDVAPGESKNHFLEKSIVHNNFSLNRGTNTFQYARDSSIGLLDMDLPLNYTLGSVAGESLANIYTMKFKLSNGYISQVMLDFNYFTPRRIIGTINRLQDLCVFFVIFPRLNDMDVKITAGVEKDVEIVKDPTTTTTTTTTTTPAPLTINSESTFDNCDSETCDVILNIIDDTETKVHCELTHGNDSFNFTCAGIENDHFEFSSFDCNLPGELTATYRVDYTTVNTVQIFCQNELNALYEDSVEINVQRSRVNFSRCEFNESYFKIFLGHVEHVEAMTGISIKELNTESDNNNNTVHYSASDGQVAISSHNFIVDRLLDPKFLYEIGLTVKNGKYSETFTTTVMPVTITGESVKTTSKPYFKDPSNNDATYFDAEYHSSFHGEFAKNTNVSYTFKWYWANDSRDEVPGLISNEEQLIVSAPRSENLYSKIKLEVSGNNSVLPSTAFGYFAYLFGVSATIEYEETVHLGEKSSFKVIARHFSHMPSQPCMLLEIDNGIVYGFMDPSSPVASLYCSGDDYPNTNITWESMQDDGDDYSSVIVNHTYTSGGNYKIKLVTYSNVQDRNVEELDVNIIDIPCLKPTVQIRGVGTDENTPTSFLKSQSFKLESEATVNCSISNVYRTNWTIFNGPDFDTEVTNSSLIFGDPVMMITSKNTPFGYGVHKVCVTIEMIVEPSLNAEECGYVDILPTPLHATLVGGYRVQASIQQNYLVDASQSIDPDTGDLSGVELYILCRKNATDPKFILTVDAARVTSFSTHVSTGDTGGCFKTGPGRLQDNNGKITLPSARMPIDETLEIVLLAYSPAPANDPRLSVFSQYLKLIAGKPPLLEIRNLQNHGKHINIASPHTLEGTCTNFCDGNLTFQWTLAECDDVFDGCTTLPHEDLLSMISTQPGSLFYSVKGNIYKPNQWYEISLKASRSEYEFGEVSDRFLVNESPKNGDCTVTPKHGIAVADIFTINCTGWFDDHLPLTYKYFTKAGGVDKVLCSSLSTVCSVPLPIGDEDNNFTMSIFMEIVDNLLGRTVLNTTVMVEKPLDMMAVIESIKLELNSSESDLYVHKENGDYLSMSNVLMGYVSVLNADPPKLPNNTINMTEEEKEGFMNISLARIEIRSSMSAHCLSAPVTTPEEINLVSGTLAGILKDPNEISPETQQAILEKAHQFIEDLTNGDFSPNAKQEAVAGVLNMAGQVSKTCGRVSDVNNVNKTAILPLKSLYPNVTYMMSQAKHCVKTLAKVLADSQRIIISAAVPGGESIVLKTDGVTVAVSKVLMSGGEAAIEADGVSASFDPSILGNDPDADEIQKASNFTEVKMMKFENPYTFVESASKVKSSITSLDLATKSGEDIKVENSDKRIALVIVNVAPPEVPENNTMSVEPNGEQWNFHQVKMHNDSYRAIITPETNGTKLTIYFRDKKQPTVEKYLYKWNLPSNESCTWRNTSLHSDEEIDFLTTNTEEYSCTRDPYLVFVSDEIEIDGLCYLGIHYIPPPETEVTEEQEMKRRRKRRGTIDPDAVDEQFCVVIKPPPPTPAPTLGPGAFVDIQPIITSESINYTMVNSHAKCLFWDDVNQDWTSNGCIVGIDTTPEKTVCLCNHLTDFGGDVMVAPNPIDMGAVFAGLKNLGDNLGVLMVILTIFLLYTVLCVWARRKDREDEIDKRIVTFDFTKDQGVAQSFIFTVVTGAGMGSGTTAKVYFILTGKTGDSGVLPLNLKKRPLYKTRSTVTLKVLLPHSIGEVESLRVFHDNSGKSPSWYLRNVVVTNTRNRKEFPFVSDSWLAVESMDGQIDKTLHVASDKDLKKFHLVFASTVSKGLLDGHIWFSIFLRPKQSSFSRVRRLSACLALIFLSMLTNAMFFGAGDAPGAKKIIYLGNLRVNFTGIMIGIQSSIIIIPPSILIVEIFRRLAPKKTAKKKSQDKEDPVEMTGNEYIDEDEMEIVTDTATKDNKKEEKKEKKEPFLFPNQCQYVAYFVVVACSGSSALVTFFYSMMWGPKKSNEWLSSMFAGFFQSVLVIQPVKAVAVAVLLAAVLRKPIKQDVQKEEEEKELKKAVKKAAGKNGIISHEEIPVIMPSDSELERARKAKLKDKLSAYIIKDILTYLFFLLVVAKLAYSEKDPNMFGYRADLMNMFMYSDYTDGPGLDKVTNPGYMYTWIRDTLVPASFAGPWYNEELPKEVGFVENHESFLISIPRVRQLRVKKESCPIHREMRNLVNHCEASYSYSNEETGDYDIAWKPLGTTAQSRKKRDNYWVVKKSSGVVERPQIKLIRERRATSDNPYQQMATGRSSAFRRRTSAKTTSSGKPIYYVAPEALLPDGSVVSCFDRWQHFTASKLNGFPFQGRLVTYSGGGYAANLGYNEETSWTVLADLHAHNWFDKQTRAAFAELTVYNANINLFATAFLFVETLPTGGAFPWADFKVFNGYRYSLDGNLSARLTELVFIIFITYFSIREIKKLLKQKLEYMKSFFNLIEILLMPLYIMMFVLIIVRWLSTAKNIKTFKVNPKDFVSFQYSAAADSALQAVIGVVSFLLNIKFLRLFQFAKSFYVVGLIFKQFAYPVGMFMIPFTLYFLLFAWVGHLGFGTQSEDFQTIVRTCVTQFLHLLGATDFHHIRESNPMFGPLYFLSYTVFMMFIVFNVFLAIICEAIDGDYEEELEKNAENVAMGDFLLRTFKDMVGIEYDYEYWKKLSPSEKYEESFVKTSNVMNQFEIKIGRMKKFVDEFEIETNTSKFESLIDALDFIPEKCENMDSINEESESESGINAENVHQNNSNNVSDNDKDDDDVHEDPVMEFTSV